MSDWKKLVRAKSNWSEPWCIFTGRVIQWSYFIFKLSFCNTLLIAHTIFAQVLDLTWHNDLIFGDPGAKSYTICVNYGAAARRRFITIFENRWDTKYATPSRVQARIQEVGAGASAHPWDGVAPFEIH